MNDIERLTTWVQVSSVEFLGPVRVRQLWQRLGDKMGSLFTMSDSEVAELKGIVSSQSLKSIRAEASRRAEARAFVEEQLARAKGCQGRILALDDPHYPKPLRNSKLSHPLIYCIGRVEEFSDFDRSIAIVGTRSPAPHSADLADLTAYELAHDGWVIVSGMAKGIDSAAHEGALRSPHGKTIAVLGCGPDVIYPREATDLYNRIRARGLVLSEFPFGTRIDSLRLKKRNKTTVALSRGVFLVETDATGGTMNALRASEEQSKPSFTIIPAWASKSSGNQVAVDGGSLALDLNENVARQLSAAIEEGRQAFYHGEKRKPGDATKKRARGKVSLKPLKQWMCDVCGEVIESPEKGYVVWRQDAQGRDCDFKVIHQGKCDQREFPLSLAVPDFLGADGLAMLLSMLSAGPIKRRVGQQSGRSPKDLDEFVDLVRRMQTPYYEEARRYFSKPELIELYADANEVLPYKPDQLKQLIQKWSK